MESALKWGFFALYVGLAIVAMRFSNNKEAEKIIDTVVAVVGVAILVYYIVRAISDGVDIWDILCILLIVGVIIYCFRKNKKD